jgi:putative spermidine/putrescine transport system ATP-binding protein
MRLAPIPITLTQCAKTFRGTRVLEPLDMQIGAGETLVLLGPSGCGKTTTLRSEMNTLLRELGITTVYVTHDQAEAMELGDRIVVMSAGRIEQIGTSRDIYYRPANRAVAQFVGTINRLAGERREGVLTTVGGAVPVPLGTSAATALPGADHNELFLRPEDAYLADPATAHLRGMIDAAAFLGERTRLTISGAAPDTLIVDVPGRVELARGTPVGISIAPEALIALS